MRRVAGGGLGEDARRMSPVDNQTLVEWREFNSLELMLIWAGHINAKHSLHRGINQHTSWWSAYLTGHDLEQL